MSPYFRTLVLACQFMNHTGMLETIKKTGRDLEMELLEKSTEVRHLILYLVGGFIGEIVWGQQYILALGMIFAIHEYAIYQLTLFIDTFGDYIKRALDRFSIPNDVRAIIPDIIVVSMNFLIGYPLFAFGDQTNLYITVLMVTGLLVVMLYTMINGTLYFADFEMDFPQENYSEWRAWSVAILTGIIFVAAFVLFSNQLFRILAALVAILITIISVNIPGSTELNVDSLGARIAELNTALEIVMRGLLWVVIIGAPIATIAIFLLNFGHVIPWTMQVLIVAGLVLTIIITVLPAVYEWLESHELRFP